MQQSAFGEDVYPSVESKAAHLLYFVVKNHPFTDGNKRSAAFLLVHFLNANERLFDDKGELVVNEAGLAALTLLVAKSAPREKDTVIRLILNLLARGDTVMGKYRAYPEYRDSGVEWPWNIPKGGKCFQFFVFLTRNNSNSSGGVTNALSLSCGRIIWRDKESVFGLLPESFNTYEVVQPNSIMVVCIWASKSPALYRFAFCLPGVSRIESRLNEGSVD